MSATELISNSTIIYAICLKVNEISNENVNSINHDIISDYLINSLWKNSKRSLVDALEDVLDANSNDIIDYLMNKAIIEGSNTNIEEFNDLLGRN